MQPLPPRAYRSSVPSPFMDTESDGQMVPAISGPTAPATNASGQTLIRLRAVSHGLWLVRARHGGQM